jgi:hypothetical protein
VSPDGRESTPPPEFLQLHGSFRRWTSPATLVIFGSVATRTSYEPVPDLGFTARVARAFAYVLLVVTCTVVAALGGYQVGIRSNPSESTSAAERAQAVDTAVAKAVAAQKATDRRLRRDALKSFGVFQREKYMALMQRRLDAQHLEDAAEAARAYRRGKAAGAAVPAADAAKTTEKADSPG